MLTNLNSKLGSDIWAFSLPRTSCHHKTEACKEYCYAKRGSFLFPSVRRHLQECYEESYEDDFVDRMVAQIVFERIKYVRVHASGDFYSQEYVDKWFEIARRCPSVKFLAYTRNYEADFSRRPPNFSMYFTQDTTTVRTNPTLSRVATAYEEEGQIRHMHRNQYGSICDSKCYKCKVCWAGKINIAFPIR